MPGRDGCFHEFVGWALHADDPVNLAETGDMAAALAMQLRRGFAQLAHFARGQNAARESWRRSEQFRQGVQSRGAGVVAIVDHRKPFCEPHDFAAFIRRLQRREYALRVFRADAPDACSCQCRYCIHHVVAPDQWQLEARASGWRDEIECGAADAALFDFLRAKFRARGATCNHAACSRATARAGAEPEHGAAGDFVKARDALVVRVQHGGRVRPRQVFNQFALGQRNLLDGREKFQMLDGDARDHAHVRRRDACQARQLAAMRHAHFDHRRVVLIT